MVCGFPLFNSYIFVIDKFLEGGLELQFDNDLDSIIFIICSCICFIICGLLVMVG